MIRYNNNSRPHDLPPRLPQPPVAPRPPAQNLGVATPNPRIDALALIGNATIANAFGNNVTMANAFGGNSATPNTFISNATTANTCGSKVTTANALGRSTLLLLYYMYVVL